MVFALLRRQKNGLINSFHLKYFKRTTNENREFFYIYSLGYKDDFLENNRTTSLVVSSTLEQIEETLKDLNSSNRRYLNPWSLSELKLILNYINDSELSILYDIFGGSIRNIINSYSNNGKQQVNRFIYNDNPKDINAILNNLLLEYNMNYANSRINFFYVLNQIKINLQKKDSISNEVIFGSTILHSYSDGYRYCRLFSSKFFKLFVYKLNKLKTSSYNNSLITIIRESIGVSEYDCVNGFAQLISQLRPFTLIYYSHGNPNNIEQKKFKYLSHQTKLSPIICRIDFNNIDELEGKLKPNILAIPKSRFFPFIDGLLVFSNKEVHLIQITISMCHKASTKNQNSLKNFLTNQGFTKIIYVYAINFNFIPSFRPNPKVKLSVYLTSFDKLIVPMTNFTSHPSFEQGTSKKSFKSYNLKRSLWKTKSPYKSLYKNKSLYNYNDTKSKHCKN